MLLSVVLLFWLFGFSVHALLATKRTHEPRLIMTAFRIMIIYLASLGLFFFFIGLLWAVSTINPMFSAITANWIFIVGDWAGKEGLLLSNASLQVQSVLLSLSELTLMEYYFVALLYNSLVSLHR